MSDLKIDLKIDVLNYNGMICYFKNLLFQGKIQLSNVDIIFDSSG